MQQCNINNWGAMRDSNPRLSPRQDDTLPAELIAREVLIIFYQKKTQK